MSFFLPVRILILDLSSYLRSAENSDSFGEFSDGNANPCMRIAFTFSTYVDSVNFQSLWRFFQNVQEETFTIQPPFLYVSQKSFDHSHGNKIDAILFSASLPIFAV